MVEDDWSKRCDYKSNQINLKGFDDRCTYSSINGLGTQFKRSMMTFDENCCGFLTGMRIQSHMCVHILTIFFVGAVFHAISRID